MKQITCEQIGIEDCPFVSIGHDTPEVTKKLHEHAKVEHAKMLEEMSDKEAEKMNEKILEILAAQPDEKPEEKKVEEHQVEQEKMSGESQAGDMSDAEAPQEPSQVPPNV